MKLPKFLSRKKDDEEDELDDSDFDPSDFEGDDYDGVPRTQVIDDDTELAIEIEDDIEAESMENFQDRADLTELDAQMQAVDEEGVDDIPQFEDDPDDVDFGDGDSEQESTGDASDDSVDDLEFDGEDFDDEDFDDEDFEDEEEAGGDPKRMLLFAGIGAGVLVLGVVGGAAFWFFSDGGEQTAEESQLSAPKGGVSVALAPPPTSGTPKVLTTPSLNEAVQSGAALQEPPPSQQPLTAAPAATGDVGADQAGQPADEGQTGLVKPKKMTSVMALQSGSLNARAGGGLAAGQGMVIPQVTSVSYQDIPNLEDAVPLASAPDQNLLEEVIGLPGPLPKVGADGRLPWEVYARPFDDRDPNPRVAIIVKGLGFSRAATLAAIRKLPGEISLAFSPYARDLNDWLLRARLAGHEVFLELPMESKDFPAEDAGPLALSTNLQVSDNMRRLKEMMSRFSGYVGVLTIMGSKFNSASGQLRPILQEIKDRGLMFVDGGTSRSEAPGVAAEIDLPKAISNVMLDEPPLRESLDRKLKQLETIIKQESTAIGTAHAYPSTIDRLLIWTRSLQQRKLTLVPVSAIANKQFIE